MSDRVVFIGGGFSSLCLGALLARGGWEVTILEQANSVGGYAQTADIGGYRFSLGPRYLWDFGPGEIGSKFFEELGLMSSSDFVKLDEDGFDEVYIGSDLAIRVPMGWEAFRQRLKETFRSDLQGIDMFFDRCAEVYSIFQPCMEKDLDYAGYRALLGNLLAGGGFFRRSSVVAGNLYRSLEDEFNRCQLSPNVRSVLSAHLAIVAEAPCDISFAGYVVASLNYHRGSYYPKKHIESLVDGLAGYIIEAGGCIKTGETVEEIQTAHGRAQSVRTADGEVYAADLVISNLDPRVTGGLLDRDSSLSRKKYSRSNSLLSFFIGCELEEGIEFPFGRGQKWYIADNDTFAGRVFGPNASHDDLIPRQLYLNSPSAFSSVDSGGPSSRSRLITGFAPGSYDYYSKLGLNEYRQYVDLKKEAILKLIEDVFWGDIVTSMKVFTLHTPIDNERLLLAPEGCIYGKRFRSRDLFIDRIPFDTAIPNLKLCSAFTSSPGLASCIRGAKFLHQNLKS